MRSILKRLSGRHTTAVAYLALFAALGGSAYAAVTVTGKNIKDGTITGKDVENSSPARHGQAEPERRQLAHRPARPRRPTRREGRRRRARPDRYDRRAGSEG